MLRPDVEKLIEWFWYKWAPRDRPPIYPDAKIKRAFKKDLREIVKLALKDDDHTSAGDT